jgi:GT2 family glycosyltransferase
MPEADDAVIVVVVTYNSADVLPDLIASLPAGAGSVPWRLVVVDNDSRDDSLGVAARLAPTATIVVTGRNGGYAAGINAGVASEPGDAAILVLNPDVRLEPNCLPVLLELVRRPGTGIAVPRLVDRHGARIDSLRREPTVLRALADALLGARRAGRIGRLGEVVSDDAVYRQEAVADWPEGSTLLISRACWRRVGPWDESYFLYSEETDFALRARDAGFRTRYTPHAGAVHLEGGSATSQRLWPLVVLNRLRLFARRHGRVQAVLFWSALVLREASRAVIGTRASAAALRALLSVRRLRETPGPHSIGGSTQ